VITWRGRRGRAVVTPERAARGPRSPHPVLEPVAEAVIAAVSVVYMVIALGYPSDAGGLPAIIAAIAAAVALFRLASRAVALIRAPRTAADPVGAADVPAVDAAFATVPGGHETGLGGRGSQPGSFGERGEPELAETGHPAAAPLGSEPAVDRGPEPLGSEPAADRGRQARPPDHRRRAARELVALGWVWAAVVLSYLFGFEIGVPVVAAAYCLTSVEWNRRWQRLVYAAVVTGTAFGIAYGFVSLFSLTFSGVLG